DARSKSTETFTGTPAKVIRPVPAGALCGACLQRLRGSHPYAPRILTSQGPYKAGPQPYHASVQACAQLKISPLFNWYHHTFMHDTPAGPCQGQCRNASQGLPPYALPARPIGSLLAPHACNTAATPKVPNLWLEPAIYCGALTATVTLYLGHKSIRRVRLVVIAKDRHIGGEGPYRRSRLTKEVHRFLKVPKNILSAFKIGARQCLKLSAAGAYPQDFKPTPAVKVLKLSLERQPKSQGQCLQGPYAVHAYRGYAVAIRTHPILGPNRDLIAPRSLDFPQDFKPT
ncbi:MAG: hypothetical protein EZS28_050747, partial [Streblomastix strix]